MSDLGKDDVKSSSELPPRMIENILKIEFAELIGEHVLPFEFRGIVDACTLCELTAFEGTNL